MDPKESWLRLVGFGAALVLFFGCSRTTCRRKSVACCSGERRGHWMVLFPDGSSDAGVPEHGTDTCPLRVPCAGLRLPRSPLSSHGKSPMPGGPP